jgi:hypothetical protein
LRQPSLQRQSPSRQHEANHGVRMKAIFHSTSDKKTGEFYGAVENQQQVQQ